MQESSLPVIASLKVEGKCLIGIDHGKSYIGLATSDRGWSIAFPESSVKVATFQGFLQDLGQLCRTHPAAAFVIGWPLEPDGREGPRCQSVKQFARNLEKACRNDALIAEMLPKHYIFWDERLSSRATESMKIKPQSLKHAPRQTRDDARDDQLAAAFMLQGFLDRLLVSSGNECTDAVKIH
jgi:putative Holliday junction resolvase